MKKEKIIFFNEKKWILAYWFKRHRNTDITEKMLTDQWSKWWQEDSFDENHEMFSDVYTWIRNILKTMSMSDIKKKRYDVADTRRVPKSLQQLAISKGYFIKKASTSHHPCVVSGYQICSREGRGKKSILYGEHYNLTLKQVKEFFEG